MANPSTATSSGASFFLGCDVAAPDRGTLDNPDPNPNADQDRGISPPITSTLAMPKPESLTVTCKYN